MTPAERRVYLAAMRAYRAWMLAGKDRNLETFTNMDNAQIKLWKACAAADKRKKGK
jgi:hypothetical protein